jgi:hypothetical protein
MPVLPTHKMGQIPGSDFLKLSDMPDQPQRIETCVTSAESLGKIIKELLHFVFH